MPQPCSICTHPDLTTINRELSNGTSLRNIARQYGVSKDALSRHKKHVSVTLRDITQAVQNSPEPRQSATLQDQLLTLITKAHTLTEAAEAAGDLRTALQGVREVRGCLDLLGKVVGDLPTGTMIGICVSPEWTAIRTAILHALEPYPQARQAVVEALDQIPSFTPAPVQVGTFTSKPRSGSRPTRLSDLMRGEGTE
jgi:hypothetical protein